MSDGQLPEGAKPAAPVKPANRSPRRRARELAVQGLYEWRVGGQEFAAIEAHLAEHEGFRDEFKRADRALFETLLRGTLRTRDELFALIAPFVDRDVADLSPIETSVLLLGTYELLHQPETPYRVIINEAIELAKTFGGTDGHKYVNGVLDKLAPKLRAAEVAANQNRRG
jgi:N utilization substance protein B